VTSNPVAESVSTFDTGVLTTSVPDIDTVKTSCTVTELLNSAVGANFDGGILREDVGGRTLTNDFIVRATGGTIDTNGYDLAIAGVLSGTGSLTKIGIGTLTLTGANSYTGGTTVSAGTLAGNTTTLQGNITNNAAVEFAQASDGTYSGNISGSGSLTKTGAGNLTLAGANSYSGGTTISAGTLAGNTTTLQGNITNNAALAFTQEADGTYAGVLSGNGA